MRIVIVEDNAKLASTIAEGLGEDGYATDRLGTAAAAIERGLRRDFDLMISISGSPIATGSRCSPSCAPRTSTSRSSCSPRAMPCRRASMRSIAAPTTTS